MAKIKICIDPGHYGNYNQSPVNKNYYEAQQMWKLHLLLKKELEAYGIEVITTRNDKNKDLDFYARGQKAKGCDLFLSLHSNATSNASVDYPLTIYPISGKGKELAQKLAKCVKNTMKTKQDGASWTKNGNNGDYYGVIRGAVSVGVIGIIIEHGFHTNKANADWLMSENNLLTLAKAEAAVIAEHYGLKKQAATTATTTATKNETATKTEKVMYRVQAGSFGMKDNANVLKNRLIAAGFAKTFIESEGGFYKVIVNTYSVKSNADNEREKVLAKGFEAIIVTIGEVTPSVSKATTPTPTTENKGEKTVTITIKQLQKGMKGEQVKVLQQLLIANGYSCGSSGADGDFGSNTEKAVKAYQKAKGIGQDGICGAKTWTKLLAAG